MKLLSFDIGIKNLAYCVLCKENQTIEDWGIINMSCDDICEHYNTKGIKCDKSATWKTTWLGEIDKGICTGHSKLKTYNAPQGKHLKRIKSKNNMHSLGVKMVEELDKIPILLECGEVIVENQPALKNPTMKSIQMMVYSYFLIKSKPLVLEMINARNKLKVYKGPVVKIPWANNQKNKYKINKYLAVEYCKYMIGEEKQDFQDLYEMSKKKDDLSDCYLQGVYFMNK